MFDSTHNAIFLCELSFKGHSTVVPVVNIPGSQSINVSVTESLYLSITIHLVIDFII